MNDDYKTCPNCGAELPRKARFCRECGSDEDTGWSSNEAFASSLDLPDDDEFDYDKFVKEEFGEKKQVKPHSISWFWWSVALALLIAIVCWIFHDRF